MILKPGRTAINGTPNPLASKVSIGIFVVDHAPMKIKTLRIELPFLSITAAAQNAA